MSLLSFRSLLGLYILFVFCILTFLLSLGWKYLSLKEINTQCSTFSSASLFLLSVNSTMFSAEGVIDISYFLPSTTED